MQCSILIDELSRHKDVMEIVFKIVFLFIYHESVIKV